MTLNEYATLCEQTVAIPADLIAHMSTSALSYYQATKKGREVQRPLRYLENVWYTSVANGKPDYSVYASPEFLGETWACYELYSKGYIRAFDNVLPNGRTLASLIDQMGSICDLGCGPGLTTAHLKRRFPKCDVCGTQVESLQLTIAKELGRRTGFTVGNIPSNADFVFASEYFEHFHRPIQHLSDVLAVTRCKMIVFANSFGAVSVGHFPTYAHGFRVMPPKAVGRAFNAMLAAHRFVRVDTGFWNNRPSVFIRKG